MNRSLTLRSLPTFIFQSLKFRQPNNSQYVGLKLVQFVCTALSLSFLFAQRIGRIGIFVSRCWFNRAFHGSSRIMFEKKKEEKHIFPTTPISELEDRSFPKTSACLIIGDEILNGKTIDSNSRFFVKFCFDRGIYLKRIEVIPDKEEEIIEAVRRFSNNYDLVVTSGGIGPTHDDITYLSIARAYNLPLIYHQPTLDRMAEPGQNVTYYLKSLESKPTKAMIEAKQRMALFPQPSRIIFPHENLWVPIVIVNENIHILPGVPKLFEALLTGYGRYLKGDKFVRKFVKTFYPETFIAPILTEAQEKVKDFGIKIGSYPETTEDGKYAVVVSFLGKGNAKVSEVVEKISKEVSKQIDGVIID